MGNLQITFHFAPSSDICYVSNAPVMPFCTKYAGRFNLHVQNAVVGTQNFAFAFLFATVLNNAQMFFHRLLT